VTACGCGVRGEAFLGIVGRKGRGSSGRRARGLPRQAGLQQEGEARLVPGAGGFVSPPSHICLFLARCPTLRAADREQNPAAARSCFGAGSTGGRSSVELT